MGFKATLVHTNIVMELRYAGKQGNKTLYFSKMTPPPLLNALLLGGIIPEYIQ